MIRIFETGDLHLGKKYQDSNKHPQGAVLAERRYIALENMITRANEENCDLFVITGDLFEKRDLKRITQRSVTRVADILKAFSGEAVLVLPGNHDYYSTGSQKDNELWEYFQERCDESKIVLLSEFAPYRFDVGEEQVVVFPAFCDNEVSEKNNLTWIKNYEIPQNGEYTIGIAHGAVQGKTIDKEGEYFVMTEKELDEIPVDIWLLGHTHVTFPDNLNENYQIAGRIFNAGTHVQDKVGRKTDGYSVILELEKNTSGPAVVRAKRFRSGNTFFRQVNIRVYPESGKGTGCELRRALSKATENLDRQNTSLSLTIEGTITEEELEKKETVYRECLEGFLECPPPNDTGLVKLYTEEMVDRQFAPHSFPSKVLKALLETPGELQMAAELMEELRGEN